MALTLEALRGRVLDLDSHEKIPTTARYAYIALPRPKRPFENGISISARGMRGGASTDTNPSASNVRKHEENTAWAGRPGSQINPISAWAFVGVPNLAME